MQDRADGRSAADRAPSSLTFPAFRWVRAVAFSRKSTCHADGEYVVNIADMATHIWGNGMEFENPLVVTVDNKLVYETVIGGEEDMKLYDQVQNGALDRVNARLKNIRFTTTAGPHKIGVAFKRKSFAESDDELQMYVPGGGQDRMYRVSSFQLLGRYNAKGLSPTPSRDRDFQLPPVQ